MHPEGGGSPDGIVKQFIKMRFNASFFNPEFYRDRPKGFGVEMETNRLINDPLLDDVINLCIHTDVVKTTGLSLADLMHLDLPTYRKIEQAVIKAKDDKIRAMEKTQQQFEERSRSVKEQIKSS